MFCLRISLPPALCFAFAACLSFPCMMQAGPPFVTDDPIPEGWHRLEVNLATQDFKTVHGWSGDFLRVDAAYGLLPDLELNFLTPLSYDAPAQGAHHVGYGDTQLGLKYLLLDEKKALINLGFAPVVFLPTGKHRLNLGNGNDQLFLPLWLQKDLGPWTVYGGGGYTFNPGNAGHENFWSAGAVVQRKISDTLALGLELYHESPEERGDSASTLLNAGATFDLNEHYHLLASAGHSVAGRATFSGYFALQITLGGEESKQSPAK